MCTPGYGECRPGPSRGHRHLHHNNSSSSTSCWSSCSSEMLIRWRRLVPLQRLLSACSCTLHPALMILVTLLVTIPQGGGLQVQQQNGQAAGVAHRQHRQAPGHLPAAQQGGRHRLPRGFPPHTCEDTAPGHCVQAAENMRRENITHFCRELTFGDMQRQVRRCLEPLVEPCSYETADELKTALRSRLSDMAIYCQSDDQEGDVEVVDFTSPEQDMGDEEELGTPSNCGREELHICMRPLLQAVALDTESPPDQSILFDLFLISAYHDRMCRTLDEIDKTPIWRCVRKVDERCAGKPYSQPLVLPAKNFTQSFRFITMSCHPGCTKLNDRQEVITNCTDHNPEITCSELQLMADCIQPAIGCCPLLHQVMKENMEPQRCPNVILQQACLYTTTTGKDQSTKKQRTASPVEDTKNLSGGQVSLTMIVFYICLSQLVVT